MNWHFYARTLCTQLDCVSLACQTSLKVSKLSVSWAHSSIAWFAVERCFLNKKNIAVKENFVYDTPDHLPGIQLNWGFFLRLAVDQAKWLESLDCDASMWYYTGGLLVVLGIAIELRFLLNRLVYHMPKESDFVCFCRRMRLCCS